MTDKEITEQLIARDERTTRWFFYEKCRPLFLSIMRNVFSYPVEYDEFVGEIYALLMENDAYRLRQFDYRSSICQWMKTVALRHFIKNKDKMIDNTPQPSPYQRESEEADNTADRSAAKMDVARLLSMMKNRRQAHVIKRLLIEDAAPQDVAEELGVTVDNLYNIKKRAMAALTQVALADKKQYSYGRNIG